MPTAPTVSGGHSSTLSFSHLFPFLPFLHLSRFFVTVRTPATYSFSLTYPRRAVLPRRREKEKRKRPDAALPTGKRRGSRFKSRIFRGRKAAWLLKASKKKRAILFKLPSFYISRKDGDAMLHPRVDMTEISLR